MAENLNLPDACWPGFGLASTILSDNGREFHGRAFRRAAEVYGVELRYRPQGHPAAGGIIERAIGTFMMKVRLLPGASFSKLLGKRPRNAIRGARMTLKDLELYLARQISVYHKTPHGTLEMPPALAWERAWRISGSPAVPRLPASADHFLLTFLRVNGAQCRAKALPCMRSRTALKTRPPHGIGSATDGAFRSSRLIARLP